MDNEKQINMEAGKAYDLLRIKAMNDVRTDVVRSFKIQFLWLIIIAAVGGITASYFMIREVTRGMIEKRIQVKIDGVIEATIKAKHVM